MKGTISRRRNGAEDRCADRRCTATAGATGRVVNLGTRSLAAEETESTGELISKPTYKLRPVSIDQLTDANTMSDKLIEHSSSKITNACGVYVDGQFVCAVKNETDAVSVFDKILNEKIGQIKSNMIDKVSDEFSDEFDKLLAI